MDIGTISLILLLGMLIEDADDIIESSIGTGDQPHLLAPLLIVLTKIERALAERATLSILDARLVVSPTAV